MEKIEIRALLISWMLRTTSIHVEPFIYAAENVRQNFWAWKKFTIKLRTKNVL